MRTTPVDRDARAFDDRADELAAGAGDVADLLDRDLDGDDAGRVGRNVLARARQRLRHLAEDVPATLARLFERRAHDVHLQGRDARRGAGYRGVVRLLVDVRGRRYDGGLYGVFEPLEKVEGAKAGTVYTVFSGDELHDLGEMFDWLKAAEKSFDFWDNPADAVYDEL